MEAPLVASSMYRWVVRKDNRYKLPVVADEVYDDIYDTKEKAFEMMNLLYPTEAQEEGWILFHYTVIQTARPISPEPKEISNDLGGIRSVAAV